MEPLYQALILFRNRKFEKCSEKCAAILLTNPSDQAAWALQLQAMTARVKMDELDAEGAEGGVGALAEGEGVWSEALATAPRPGTSLRNPLQTVNTALVINNNAILIFANS